jgi:hypothetical protein
MKGFVSQALALMGMAGSMGGPWKSSAADRGNFVTWLQQRANPIGGMYLAIGQRHDKFTSVDRGYMVIALPPEPHTFKVVIGWKDHDDRTDDREFERLLWRP